MNNGLMVLVASTVMYSVAFASPTANEASFTGVNATEHAALFGESSTAQVVALDAEEMKSTQGEVVLRVARMVASTLVTYVNAPTNKNEKAYTRYPYTNQYIGNQYADYTYNYNTKTYTTNTIGGMYTNYTR